MIDASLVADRVAAVRRRIDDAGGVAVTLVAVTKGFGPDAIEAVAGAGVADIGENYAQELAVKADTARRLGLVVHFIGRLQTNKVRSLVGTVGFWQSVDRPAIAIEIAKRAPGARVLVEVNVSGEAQKGGCDPTDADKIVGECARLGLDVQGLMAIGRAGEPEDALAWLPSAASHGRRSWTRRVLDGDVGRPRNRGRRGCDNGARRKRAVRRKTGAWLGRQVTARC